MFLSVEVRRTQFDQTATQASTIVRVTVAKGVAGTTRQDGRPPAGALRRW